MSHPRAKRPPLPGLGLISNELSASVSPFLVATCAHCEQLAGGREAVGCGLVLFYTKQMKHKANQNESTLAWQAGDGRDPREATSREQALGVAACMTSL